MTPRKTRRLVAAGLVAAAAVIWAGLATASASTDAPGSGQPLVYTCQADPCQNAQEFEVFDYTGAPIFSVGEFGDPGVFGTGFAVYPPASVTNPVVTLNDNGTVTVGGQVLTAHDIWFLHRLETRGSRFHVHLPS